MKKYKLTGLWSEPTDEYAGFTSYSIHPAEDGDLYFVNDVKPLLQELVHKLKIAHNYDRARQMNERKCETCFLIEGTQGIIDDIL